MHTPTEPPLPYTGFFSRVSLGFTPEPPLPPQDLRRDKENYSTELADIHVYLDGSDAAASVISAYLLWLLDDLLVGIPKLLEAGNCIGKWYSDPWRFELQGYPASNQVAMTLHIPNRRAVIQDACVPLDEFCREVIRLSHEWENYLDGLYHDEMVDPVRAEQYRIFRQYLEQAELAVRDYEHKGA